MKNPDSRLQEIWKSAREIWNTGACKMSGPEIMVKMAQWADETNPLKEHFTNVYNANETLRQQLAIAKEALENIKKNIEYITPTGFELSANWNIANKAIAQISVLEK